MSDREKLVELASQIDVIELAGRIIADPRRVRVSLAGELALASAVETFWAIAVEAHVLVRALALPETNLKGLADTARLAAIDAQAANIRKQLAALGGSEEQE